MMAALDVRQGTGPRSRPILGEDMINDKKMIGHGEAAMMPTSRTAMVRIRPRTMFKKMLKSKAYDGPSSPNEPF